MDQRDAERGAKTELKRILPVLRVLIRFGLHIHDLNRSPVDGGFGLGLVGFKIFPIVSIGGLDSIAGTIIAAVFVGVLESLATGYLDPHVGGGCGVLASYLTLIAMLFVRPFGLFGREHVQRI